MNRVTAISVVVPARNRAHTLPACLDSVVTQTHRPTEVIVVDDGSTDDTRAVVAAYADRGVKYHRLEQGSGAQAARNEGIRCAAGPWIAFQDSDDLWVVTKLATQVRDLTELGGATEDTVVYCDGTREDLATGTSAYMSNGDFEGDCLAKLLVRPGPMFQGMLVAKSLLLRIGLLDEDCPSFQEWDTSIRLAKIARFHHIPESLFKWNWHSGTTISKDGPRAVMGFHYVIEKHREMIRCHCGERAWRRLKLRNLTAALRNNMWGEVLQWLAPADRQVSFRLVRMCARWKVFPRGFGRVLTLVERALG